MFKIYEAMFQFYKKKRLDKCLQKVESVTNTDVRQFKRSIDNVTYIEILIKLKLKFALLLLVFKKFESVVFIK